MKSGIMPIVRTEISKDVEKYLNKKIINLYGDQGSGKSYLAKAISNNYKIYKNYDYVSILKCVNIHNKENDSQIFDYDSFLSKLLNNYDAHFTAMTSDVSIKTKEETLKLYLKEKSKKILFVLDDFENLAVDGNSILNFFSDESIISFYPIIITSTNKIWSDSHNLMNDFIKERKIEIIKKNDFEEICKKYISSIENKVFQQKILKIRKAVGSKKYYDFLSSGSKIRDKYDLCLMKDIQHDIVLEIFNGEKNCSLSTIKDKFNIIERDYKIARNDLIKKILNKLNQDEKKILHSISLFDVPVSLNVLGTLCQFDQDKIKRIENTFNKLYLFEGFLNKESVLEKNKLETGYTLIKPVKTLLKIEREQNFNVYSDLLKEWIKYFLDEDFSELEDINKNFDNISKVLQFCYENKYWSDYYEISDKIWYFCELKNKDINEYHYKRFEVALKIENEKKIIDSALHYYSISCKIDIQRNETKNTNTEDFKHISSQAKRCYQELEAHIYSNTIPERLKIKFVYTKALNEYAEKKIAIAHNLFKECEDKLPKEIRLEKNKDEKIKLIKDYISTIKWHSKCFLENDIFSNKDFNYLNNVIDKAISYELNFEIDYSRVIVSILISRIQIVLKQLDKIEDYKQIIINDYAVLEALYDSTIKKDHGLLNDFTDIKNSISNFNIKNTLNTNDKLINKTIKTDTTQNKIIPILENTRKIFLKVIKEKNNGKGNVIITAMPDLGLANNVLRMTGGFFTGMFIEWESEVPIVPIDSTVNSCGVAIYLLKKQISTDMFKSCFSNIDKKIKNDLGYNWNFQRGNHFITLGELENINTKEKKYCVIMHASADEYKKDKKNESLYPPNLENPDSNVWYLKDIQTKKTNDKNRYFRYLYGDAAKKFISIAIRLKAVNHNRMKEISEYLFKEFIDSEYLFVPHYGMPSNNSIAIGCSWEKKKSILLTAPGKDIFIIEPNTECYDKYWLTPHGLGVSASINDISYNKEKLYVDDKLLLSLEDVKEIKDRDIRCTNYDEQSFYSYIKDILPICNAKATPFVIHPKATLSANGFTVFDEG